jgi:hypothetical protein
LAVVSVIEFPGSNDDMPVSLALKRRNGAYTTLDYVEGDVHLEISSSETIENVIVKVEGSILLESYLE